MKIGILGPKGTFSDVAFHKYKKDQQMEAFYYTTLEETTQSLSVLDKIIVPLENTLEGYVQQILDFLIREKVYIEEELLVPVQFSLIKKDKSSDIKNIYVQFAAKGQCQIFLQSLKDISLTLTSSNTQSLHLFNESDETHAAIIPTHLANKNCQNVTDIKENYTRFIVLSKNKTSINNHASKVSLVVVPTNDRPGLLYDILYIFKSLNINLTSIMSRPQKDKMGKYHFFIEFNIENNIETQITKLINQAKENFDIKILGIYPRV